MQGETPQQRAEGQKLADRLDVQKKTVLENVRGRSAPRPATLKLYAEEFSSRLGRPVTVAEIQGKSDT